MIKPLPAFSPVSDAQLAPTKTEILVSLLWRAEGATLQQMAEATGLRLGDLKASLAAVMRRRQTISVMSRRVAGDRVYAIIPERESGDEADLAYLVAQF